MAKKSYEDNGVLLSKKTFYVGDKVKVSYTGLLAQAGAQNVFLYIGYGEMWENSLFIPMNPEQGVFTAEFEILEGKSFGICFKDAIENWDNNSGENYVFTVSKKPVKKEKDLVSNVKETEAPKPKKATKAPKVEKEKKATKTTKTAKSTKGKK